MSSNYDTNSAYSLIDDNVLKTKTAGYFTTNTNNKNFATFSQKPNLTSEILVTVQNGQATDIEGVSFIDPYYYSNAFPNDKNGLLYDLPSDSEEGVTTTTVFAGATTQSFAALSKLNGVNTFPTISVGGGAATAATVASIVVDNNKNIYVGGNFTSVNGVTRNGFARFDFDASTGSYTLNDTSPYNGDTFKAGFVVTAIVTNPATGTVVCAYSTGFVSYLTNFNDFLKIIGDPESIRAMTIDTNDDLYVVIRDIEFNTSYVQRYKAPLNSNSAITFTVGYQINGTTITTYGNYFVVNNVTVNSTSTLYDIMTFSKTDFSAETANNCYTDSTKTTRGRINALLSNDNQSLYVGGFFEYITEFLFPSVFGDGSEGAPQALKNFFYATQDFNQITVGGNAITEEITAITFDASNNLYYACNSLTDGLYVRNCVPISGSGSKYQYNETEKLVVAPYSPQNTIGTLALTEKTVLMGGAFECQYLNTTSAKGTIVYDVSVENGGIYLGNCISPPAENALVQSIVQSANKDIYILYTKGVLKTAIKPRTNAIFTITAPTTEESIINTVVTDASNNVFFGGNFSQLNVSNTARNIAIYNSSDVFINNSYQAMVSDISTLKTNGKNVRVMAIAQNVMYVGGDSFVKTYDLNNAGAILTTFAPNLGPLGSNLTWFVDKIQFYFNNNYVLLCGSFQGASFYDSSKIIKNLASFNSTGALLWPTTNELLNVKSVEAVALDDLTTLQNLYLSYTDNNNNHVVSVYETILNTPLQFPTPPSGVTIRAFCVDNDTDMVYYGGSYANSVPYIGAAPIPNTTGVEVVLPKVQGTGSINTMLINPTMTSGKQLIIGGEDTIYANCTKDLSYIASNSAINLVDFKTSTVIDLTYGENCTGTVITDISNADNIFGGATYDTTENQIYVAATVNGNSFAVVKYSPEGVRDTTFDTDHVTKIFGPGGCEAHAVALNADLDVFVVGKDQNMRFVVVDYFSRAAFSFNQTSTAYCITIKDSNNLFVAGNVAGNVEQFFIAKLQKVSTTTTPISTTIIPDTTFNGGNVFKAAVGSLSSTRLNSIVLDEAGNVLTAGETGSAIKINMLLVKLTSSGVPPLNSDSNSFNNGVRIFDAAVYGPAGFSSRAVSVVLVESADTSSQKIVVAGNVYNDTAKQYYVCLVKFTANGVLDTDTLDNFGTTSPGITISRGMSNLVVSDMKVSNLGNFLVAGTFSDTPNSFVKLYNSTGHPIGMITSSDGLGGVQFAQKVLDDSENQIFLATSTNMLENEATSIEPTTSNVVVQKYFNKQSLLRQQYFSGTANLGDNGNLLLFINNESLTLSGSVVFINSEYAGAFVTLNFGVTGSTVLDQANSGGFIEISKTLSVTQANYIQDGGNVTVSIVKDSGGGGGGGMTSLMVGEEQFNVVFNNYGGGSDISGNTNGQLIVNFTDYNKFEYTATINTNTPAASRNNSSYYAVFSFATGTVIPLTGPSVVLQNTFTLTVQSYAVLLANGGATFDVYAPDGSLVLRIPIQGLRDVPLWPQPPVICFKEGSKILTSMGYVRVEDLVEGHLVQTNRHGVLPICAMGRSRVYNSGSQVRIKDRLYAYRGLPGLFEDLVLTGLHSVLVDKLSSLEEAHMMAHFGQVKQTDGKYHLLAHKDARATPYEQKGTFNVYHLALECDDRERHYGIFANGLLVESCSLDHINALHLC